jgi:hypothetical protein
MIAVCDTIRPSWQHDCTINLAKRRNSNPTPVYLNLLTITAIIRSTSTVMIAIVTILFVAILGKIRQHKSCSIASPQARQIPSRHSLERLVAPVRVPLTLQKSTPRVLNDLALARKIRQRIAPNILRLERQPLALPQPPTAPLQPIRAAQQLLPLLQLIVPRRVVRVPLAEQRRLVVLQRLELALRAVHVALVVPEALVHFDFEVLRDVGLLQAHGAQDLGRFFEGALGLADGGFPGLAGEFGDLVEFLAEVGLD